MHLGSYMVHFIVYILAMAGVGFIAYIVWKNATNFQGKMAKSSMKIEDTLNLAPRKSLYIIRIQNERFLIASDADKTTLLSKLEEGENPSFESIQQELNNEIQDNIIQKIKLKEEEEEEEITEEKKPVNILKELLKNKGAI